MHHPNHKIMIMKKTFLVTIMVLSIAALGVKAQTTAPKQKSITVSGTAETEITPDIIYVQVDLREYDKKGAGKISIDNIKANFLQACKNAGIADSLITVNSYQGYNNIWLEKKNRKKDPDMKAGISYLVKLSTPQQIDKLVDALDDEATQNFFIAKLDYSKMPELKKQLKINAIKAAKAKAQYLTEAIDEHIGGAISITDGEDNNYGSGLGNVTVNGYYPQVRAQSNMTYDFDKGSGGIAFKKMKFQFQVNVEFALQ